MASSFETLLSGRHSRRIINIMIISLFACTSVFTFCLSSVCLRIPSDIPLSVTSVVILVNLKHVNFASILANKSPRTCPSMSQTLRWHRYYVILRQIVMHGCRFHGKRVDENVRNILSLILCGPRLRFFIECCNHLK